MGVVKELLQDVEIPKFYKVANKMDDTHIEDVAQAVRDALKREGTLDRIKPGQHGLASRLPAVKSPTVC